jgi:Cu/Zn superoxide dismutase
MLYKAPDAVAYIKGGHDYSGIRGIAKFYATKGGILVYTEVGGLPFDSGRPFRIFAYHIHSGDSCEGDHADPFADALAHYNPTNAEHPYHAGDLPPLFANYGFAWNTVLTSRFNINEIIGRAVIIHLDPDDFVTQPSGNSGEKIACGIIEKY